MRTTVFKEDLRKHFQYELKHWDHADDRAIITSAFNLVFMQIFGEELFNEKEESKGT